MFDWHKYLNLAQELSEKDDEEFKRSAISRAYYSAYCNARNFLESKGLGLIPGKKNDHQAIWNAFSKLKGADLVSIATTGDRLKQKRKKADYDDRINNLDKITKRAITEAETINSIINENL
ncbi:hypothetical protein H8R29_23460 [Priestia megaterium]|uniref:HEPN domain-containing protein n=1 Tax=Priestia megaterium (strain ATCC 14581 / DSM 32 / CCUG 1817 / JCM 2506 / NBRC 15308 / NCIMB 9376 / NCTC 10342 / NRRL B-14308 / VKM B-512 / Ford 19) TaxID=1348623 RepID=A0A0B6AW00_PRIM2|nr:hypothetical protein [Priestia megaterium]AJI24858.1 hypothetical protein BG04_1421 [Priestia megaterium NBRC 15308 = ATCC 14581]KGJ84251.1 hypothetical protein BMT_13330 [Priestia megaterium NBRC 15308 = ATCC 14581]MDR4230474.1 hypothetical protein [Priestia megaterium]MED3805627.1 hypothetical protein [Priestia megaterium]MED4396341.1 hypothetical protein [Priestia megaterium]